LKFPGTALLSIEINPEIASIVNLGRNIFDAKKKMGLKTIHPFVEIFKILNLLMETKVKLQNHGLKKYGIDKEQVHWMLFKSEIESHPDILNFPTPDEIFQRIKDEKAADVKERFKPLRTEFERRCFTKETVDA
jgi:hypothetical protein